VTQRRAAAPYAKALCALAKERNQTELVGRELGDGGGGVRQGLFQRRLFAWTVNPPRSVASVGEAALPFAAGENECPP
jgi:hypothetical protein